MACTSIAAHATSIRCHSSWTIVTSIHGDETVASQPLPKHLLFVKDLENIQAKEADEHFLWLNNTLGNNNIECKKLATIVSGRKT